MSGLGRAIRAEWLRLRAGRAPLLLPLAALLAAAYALGLSAAVASGLMGAPSGFYLAAAAGSGVAITAAAVGALHAAGALAADQASGLLRTVLSRPLGRAAWLTGRLVALALGQACLFLSASAGALAAGLVRFGAPAASDGGYLIASGGFLSGQLLTALGLSLLAQVAAVCLGGAVGILIGRPPAAVVAVCLLAAALLALTRWPSAERLLPLATVTTPLDRVAELAQGIAAHRAGDGALQAGAVCLIWLGVALAVGALSLDRMDVVT
jgi:ABC-type transport system involved in multi-copper enzyme maturation permease subunit